MEFKNQGNGINANIYATNTSDYLLQCNLFKFKFIIFIGLHLGKLHSFCTPQRIIISIFQNNRAVQTKAENPGVQRQNFVLCALYYSHATSIDALQHFRPPHYEFRAASGSFANSELIIPLARRFISQRCTESCQEIIAQKLYVHFIHPRTSFFPICIRI